MNISTPFSKFSHGLISALVCFLAACGGGGGGSTPAVNQAPVANAGTAQNVAQLANVLVSGSASADPEGSALTYNWVFATVPAGSNAVLSNANSVSASFTPNVAGSYVLTLTVTDPQGLTSTASVTITVAVNKAPVANAGAAQNVVQLANVLLSGSASTDPEGSALTYAWVFTSVPAGNTVVLNNASAVNANFTPNVAGSYVLTLTVTDPQGLTSTASVSVTVAANTAPVANAGAAQTVYRGSLVTLSGAASSDANGHTLSYAWTLPTRPTGSTASLSGANTVSPTFTPDVTGAYTAQLIVTDSLGSPSSASTVTITVNNSPAIVNNAFSPACAGANCAAVGPNQYSGTGTGVWRYNNTTASDATINLDINGISVGKKITMSFTNPTAADVITLPAIGTNVSTDLPLFSQRTSKANADYFGGFNSAAKSVATRLDAIQSHDHAHQKMHDHAHHQTLERNKVASQALRHTPKLTRSQMLARQQEQVAMIRNYAPPAVGATKTWTDYPDFNTVTAPSYATTNQHVCALGNGRSAVFWKDTANTALTPSILSEFTTAACGSTGGFSKLISLVGDVWGNHFYSALITETTLNKQDINVVFVDVPSAPWAGYFFGRNNLISTPTRPSNEALVFFINSAFVTSTNTDFFVSTLIHEARHMINYYQNDIVRGKTTDTWLEETTAMMSEDIIAPTITASGFNKITSSNGRLGNYIDYGGAVSLNKWENSNQSYDMGGSFAAFLNRQYGVTLTQQLVTGCTTGTALNNSYTCLNNLIQANGGISLGEELSRMGATVFSKMPATTSPVGFGYKSKVSGGYTLGAVDLSAAVYDLGLTMAMTPYKSTAQVYHQTTVPAGFTRYKRNGVVVPAGTVLQVVIQ